MPSDLLKELEHQDSTSCTDLPTSFLGILGSTLLFASPGALREEGFLCWILSV